MSSLYSSSQSISQAFLPTRGMRFAGAGDARVHDWKPAGSSVTQLQSRPAATALAAYPPGTALSAGATTAGGGGANGAISGGMLRPGAIDQTQFKAMLAATQAGVPGAGIAANSPLPAAPSSGLLPLAPNAALAAQGLHTAPPDSFSTLSAPAAAGAGGAIQDLTPAQFAALTGGAVPGLQQMAAVASPAAATGAPPEAVPTATGAATAGRALAPQNGMMDTLTLTDAAIPPDGTEQSAAVPQTASTNANGAAGTADGTPIGSTDKNGVLVLNQIPDRETRREYADKGIKWRVVDSAASDRLFFGADGKFGWDDVVDLINPLQHIPLINIAYRHFTGDQQTGSAELLGSLPFGPLSALTAIADLAVRSTTGRDIGENVIALVTGDHDSSADSLAQAGNGNTTTGAPATAISSVDPSPSQAHADRSYA